MLQSTDQVDAHLLRPQRDDAGGPAGRRGDEHRPCARTSATRRASIISGSGPKRASTTRARTSRRLHAAPSRPRSCSPAAARKPTTSRCAASPRRSSRPGGAHLIASAHRARGGPRHAQGARAARLDDDSPAGRRDRHRPPGGARGGLTDRDGDRVGHARQQRDRHHPADCELARLAHARGALFHTDAVQSVGEDPGRRARARRRPAVALGAQVQRPEGGRRAVDQARHAADART